MISVRRRRREREFFEMLNEKKRIIIIYFVLFVCEMISSTCGVEEVEERVQRVRSFSLSKDF
jgi:hypothetical protein